MSLVGRNPFITVMIITHSCLALALCQTVLGVSGITSFHPYHPQGQHYDHPSPGWRLGAQRDYITCPRSEESELGLEPMNPPDSKACCSQRGFLTQLFSEPTTALSMNSRNLPNNILRKVLFLSLIYSHGNRDIMSLYPKSHSWYAWGTI